MEFLKIFIKLHDKAEASPHHFVMLFRSISALAWFVRFGYFFDSFIRVCDFCAKPSRFWIRLVLQIGFTPYFSGRCFASAVPLSFERKSPC